MGRVIRFAPDGWGVSGLGPYSDSRRFEATDAAVESARRFVADVLGTGRAEAGVVALLVSELATNVVRHAQTSFVVAVSVSSNVRVEVTDGSPLQPVLAVTPGSATESGLGLVLVNTLAVAWGYYPSAEGKTVWFETSLNHRRRKGSRPRSTPRAGNETRPASI